MEICCENTEKGWEIEIGFGHTTVGLSTVFEEFGAGPVDTTATIKIIPVDMVICYFELGTQSSFDFLS